jgi:DNA repair ATPase RecN
MVLESVTNNIPPENAKVPQANANTNIISNKFLKEDDTVEEMLEKLDNMESMCSKLDREQKIKDDLEQISINKSSLQELENQDKRIEELAEIVKHMRIEKGKRDIISNKCRVNKQRNLDSNYAKVEALSKEGFLKDESHKVNVNIPKDGIKFDLSDLTDKINKLRPKTKKQGPNKVCNLPKKHGFDLNKLNNGICHKCNPDTLKKDIDLIHKNFGNI